jgi:GNAT superfamily N-acetyltransferase
MSVRIAAYEAPMAAQVAALFRRQYGVAAEAFLDRFARFYEHPYQRGRCVRVVALDGDDVVGFTGFAVWPYTLDGRPFRSFQCCDVLLAPRWRGRGVFPRMMDAVDDADFIVGFPVEAAKNAFLRIGWANVLDLQWYVKLLAPWRRGALASSPSPRPPSLLRLTDDAGFVAWRRNYSHRSRTFVDGPFELKPIRRLRLLRELIVGDVHADDADFAALVKRTRGATYLSIALNPLDPLVSNVVRAGFRKVDRKIAFIVKPFSCEDLVTDPSRWRLFRADLDTW